MPLLEVNNLKKVYTTRFGGSRVEALKNVGFSVEEGEYDKRTALFQNIRYPYGNNGGR